MIGVGEPYSYSFTLERRRGRLRVRTVPGDARIQIDDRVVGLGSFDGDVDLGRHVIAVLVYLGFVAFLPFPAGLLGEYGGNAVAVSFFAIGRLMPATAPGTGAK